jgi:hypothetical protein
VRTKKNEAAYCAKWYDYLQALWGEPRVYPVV